MEQLRVLLLDSDVNTRANAAIALARNADVGGIPAMITLLRQGASPISKAEFASLSEAEQQQELSRRSFEEPSVLTNCMTAVARLWPRIRLDQQTEIRQSVTRLANNHRLAGVRLQAGILLRETDE